MLKNSNHNEVLDFITPKYNDLAILLAIKIRRFEKALFAELNIPDADLFLVMLSKANIPNNDETA